MLLVQRLVSTISTTSPDDDANVLASPMATKKPRTIGESLYWSYANLAMAHAALSKGATSYSRTHYVIRSKLYKGLRTGTMSLGPLTDDERVKLVVDKRCCYCGKDGALSLRAWRTGLLSRSVATSETVERPANLSGAGWKLEPIWQIDSDDPWGLKRGH